MFSQDSQPSTSQSSFDRAFEHGQPIQPPPVPSAASGGTKRSNQRERWGFDDEKVLLQLWADNMEKVESKDSRKAWEEICKALNERQGLKKTVDQCQRKVKHLKNQYKEKKDWNRRQSGGNLRKSPHYDIIDSVLGYRDIITCNNVEQAGTQAARRFKAARANICRWRMLHNAYKPIRFCTLNKLNRDSRNVAKKS